MREISDYASARGIKPTTVLQSAAGLSGTTWEKWQSATSSCSIKTADRIRAFMAANPVRSDAARQEPEEDAA